MLTDLQKLLHMFPMWDLFGGIRQRGLSPSAASHFNTGVGVFMFCPCSTAATRSFESSLQKKCKLGMCWAGTGGGGCVTHKQAVLLFGLGRCLCCCFSWASDLCLSLHSSASLRSEGGWKEESPFFLGHTRWLGWRQLLQTSALCMGICYQRQQQNK